MNAIQKQAQTAYEEQLYLAYTRPERIDRPITKYEREQAAQLTLARVWRGIKFAAAAIIVGGLIGLIYVHVGPWGFVAISASYLVGHFFGKAEGEKKQ